MFQPWPLLLCWLGMGYRACRELTCRWAATEERGLRGYVRRMKANAVPPELTPHRASDKFGIRISRRRVCPKLFE